MSLQPPFEQPMSPPKLTTHDVTALCDVAQRAWYEASSEARRVGFTWRGRQYVSTLTSLRMFISTDKGEHVCCRWFNAAGSFAARNSSQAGFYPIDATSLNPPISDRLQGAEMSLGKSVQGTSASRSSDQLSPARDPASRSIQGSPSDGAQTWWGGALTLLVSFLKAA